ncbi:MAG: hypothetical protein ACJ711_10760 [Ornithinibacter sp.]
MTHPTDELTRMLRGAADDMVQRERVPGPDAPRLWRRGRRATWAGRGAAAAIAAFVLFFVVSGGLALTGIAPTVPAVGSTLTYPEVVSDMFVDQLPAGSGPVFGVVRAVPTSSQPDDILVIRRQGSLASLQTTNPSNGSPILLFEGGTPVLSPDGQRLLTSEGVVVLDDGVVVPPVITYPEIPSRTGVNDVWSPDSQHVLLSTVAGPAVTNGYADVALSPGPGDDAVLAAGWRGNDTVLGVRPAPGGGLDILARGLTTDTQWSKVASVAADAVSASGPSDAVPERVFASPDGSRVLLVYAADAAPPRSVLVDATTGARVAFAGETPSTRVVWDGCAPVWQAGQPLTADGGLRRPATGESVLRFSGHRQHGCVSLAGNELTGSPAPGAAGAWQERAWQVWTAALPVGGVLLLLWTAWMLVALRRSRKHGEDFLPMMLGRLF